MLSVEDWTSLSRRLEALQHCMLNGWADYRNIHENLRIWLHDNVNPCPFMMLDDGGCRGISLAYKCSFQFNLQTGLIVDTSIPFLLIKGQDIFIAWLECEHFPPDEPYQVSFRLVNEPQNQEYEIDGRSVPNLIHVPPGLAMSPILSPQHIGELLDGPVQHLNVDTPTGLTGQTVEIKNATYDPLYDPRHTVGPGG